MPGPDLALLLEAAAAAGEIASKHWRQDPESWDKPGGAGPVTEADLAVDKMLRAELGAARPDYGWLSEESGDASDRLGHARVFIIDPIDGTRSFLAGERTWAHSLAIAEAGQITAAVVHLPVREKTYAAEAGQGAMLNGTPIRARTEAALDGAEILCNRQTLRPEHWREGPPPVKQHFRTSLAYRLSLVAEGRYDGMMTLRDTWEWDIAAGALIVAESGALATDRRGQLLRFNRPEPFAPGIVAAPAGLGAALRAGLRAP